MSNSLSARPTNAFRELPYPVKMHWRYCFNDGNLYTKTATKKEMAGDQSAVRLETLIGTGLLQSGGDAIICADRSGVIRFWSPGAVRIFGFETEEAIGHSLDIIIPANLRARHWEGYRHVMQTGASRYGEGDILSVPGVRKNGTRISLEFTVTLLRERHGQIGWIVAVMRDVTSRFNELRTLKKQISALSEDR